jgi:hypothetical protein
MMRFSAVAGFRHKSAAQKLRICAGSDEATFFVIFLIVHRGFFK